jgi:hypothetical protein
MSTTSTYFGSAEAQAARSLIGGDVIGDTRNDLLKQILVAMANKASGLSSINVQTGTSYTLAITDSGKLITLDNGSAITLTIPPSSSVAFDVGAQVLVEQLGAGVVTFAPGSGVTLLSYDSNLSLAGQYAGATLIKLATDTWTIQGNLA